MNSKEQIIGSLLKKTKFNYSDISNKKNNKKGFKLHKSLVYDVEEINKNSKKHNIFIVPINSWNDEQENQNIMFKDFIEYKFFNLYISNDFLIFKIEPINSISFTQIFFFKIKNISKFKKISFSRIKKYIERFNFFIKKIIKIIKKRNISFFNNAKVIKCDFLK